MVSSRLHVRTNTPFHQSYYSQGYGDYTNINPAAAGAGQTYSQYNGANAPQQNYPSYPSAPPSYPTQQAAYNAATGMDNNAYGYGYNTPNWYGYGSTPSAPQQHRQKKPPKPKLENFHCDICDVNCAGQDAYTTHVTGKKHAIQSRKKLQSATDQRYAPYPAPAGGGTTAGSDATVIGPAPSPNKTQNK